jgi:hypothetical protein
VGCILLHMPSAAANSSDNRREAASSVRAALEALINGTHHHDAAGDDVERDGRVFCVLRDAIVGSAQGTHQLRVTGVVSPGEFQHSGFRARFEPHATADTCFTVVAHGDKFKASFHGFSRNKVRVTIHKEEPLLRTRVTCQELRAPTHPHAGVLISITCPDLRWFFLEVYVPSYC